MLHSSENNTDILIIGGGVIGICAAYYLAKRGRKVTLIEKAEIGAGSSYGNAGLIVPSHLIPLPAPGVLSQGLKWMLDGESPFYIKPRLDLDLLRWLWRFRGAAKTAPMRKSMPVLGDLGRTSAQLYEKLVTEERLACEYEQAGGLSIFRTEHGLLEARAEAQLLKEYGVEATILDGDGARELEPSIGDGVLGGIFYPRGRSCWGLRCAAGR
jgi:D-amino-acid dehydrogenase